MENEVPRLNKTIDKYNLVVPMLRGQLFHVRLEKEVIWALQRFHEDLTEENLDLAENKTQSEDLLNGKGNLLDNMTNFFHVLCERMNGFWKEKSSSKIGNKEKS